jgi:hypothetical protein|nr:MAG TPA: structural protein [Caudoviricetes sp.]
MARRATTKAAAPKTTTAKTTVEQPVVSTAEITNETMVECRSGVSGSLIYKSSLNPGYVVEWNSLGEIQEMEYRELVSMRGNQRRFFEENWILIDDPAVIKKLGVGRYYQNSLSTDDFEDVFNMSADEIKEIVPTLPGGTKDAIASEAKKKIDSGELDSRSAIKALEDSLDVELEDTI